VFAFHILTCIAWHARLLPSFYWYSLTDREEMAVLFLSVCAKNYSGTCHMIEVECNIVRGVK